MMLWGFARAAAAIAAVAAVTFAMLAAPPSAVACTGCSFPFREWLGDSPVAVYRLDRAHSRWSERPAWLHDDREASCGLAGTLLFRRMDTIRGSAPATIIVRMRTIHDSCPWWGFIDGQPTGRWIVVDPAGYGSWWHVKANGVVDSWLEGEGGPNAVPTTLEGWYRDVRAPDTATVDPVAPSAAPRSPMSPLLIVAAAGGLLVGLRRSRWRDSRATERARRSLS
jgi:hypothetical protein